MRLGVLRECSIFLVFALLVVRVESSRNPFYNQTFYVNPANSREYERSIATAKGSIKKNLEVMQKVPSAYWIDVKAKIRGKGTQTLEGILKDASTKSPPELVTIIWYDLPNRDCDAAASNGEICCYKKSDGTCDYEAVGDCADGLHEYKTEYVDPFVSVLKEYDGKLPVIVIMEPDSLANLATNNDHPHCGNHATQTAYKAGVKYALYKLTKEAPSTSIYLDAAHGGWLGWMHNLKLFMTTLKKLDLPWDSIRGFALNVANYQPLGIQCPWCPDQDVRNGWCLQSRHSDDPCCADPCDLLVDYNFGNNELNYAAGLVAEAKVVLGIEAHVVIDTGRSGVADMRQDCDNWCNPREAGAGIPSTTDTVNKSLVDAYFWLKTPGESDGCSQTLPDGSKCARFDSMCASEDSLGAHTSEPAAPEAGEWFDFQVKQLAANANFEGPKKNSDADSDGGVCDVASVVPVSDSGCAMVWQQCGGQGWTGPSCCDGGCTCEGDGMYYSQCKPPAGVSEGCGAAPGNEPGANQVLTWILGLGFSFGLGVSGLVAWHWCRPTVNSLVRDSAE